MKTPLDDAYTWFLEALGYRDGWLVIVVAEGFRAAQPSDIELPGVGIHSSYVVAPADDSRRMEIRFEGPVVWQCINESWTAYDEYEQWDDGGNLPVLARSRYLDYVNASHGWYAEIVGPGQHYRVWTEYEVIEVVASAPPSLRILEWPPGSPPGESQA